MPLATLSAWTEAEIIAEIERAFSQHSSVEMAAATARSVRLGIGDDAALLRLKPGEELVVTTDTAVEGEDFDFSCFPADAVGYRAMQQNLSDLAAMGAQAMAMLLSVAAAASTPRRRLQKILNGMAQAAAEAHCPLVGGDLSATQGPMNLSLTLLGRLPSGQALRRSRALPGDELWVSGHLGAASCGLDALLKRRRAASSTASLLKALRGPRRAHYQKFLQPQAQLALGLFLRTRARACIDLSDGLLVDARRLAVASAVSIHIDSLVLPRIQAVPLAKALYGGEDFELLFSLSPGQGAAMRRWSKKHKIALTKIGSLQEGQGLFVDGKRVEKVSGFDHFS